MATMWTMYEKPSALTADERAEMVSLWERSCGVGPRLTAADRQRFRALRARAGR